MYICFQIDGLLGDKFTHITRNLMMTLSANGRIKDAHKVIADFEDMMNFSRGVVKATIISAEPLKKKILDSLQPAVSAMAGKGATVELDYRVDPNILGGLQVIVGDKFLDLSVKRRLTDLSVSLESA
jgi:ATP synthase F1 delta subunit